ncbi:acyl-CoA dehydrogenase family protein (plasmid) [Rhodococcus pyridinivorans]|uniref:acyl-CoA dehydrogenase family protein n=1 Tax=Rhodococcus TaxID=1827 RepID=UPI0007D9BDA0|nr:MULTISPECIES: acyl-CoA dehydrogenase family protein [Rhodococcus]MCT7293634.1 acyl-CoA dehydrogenase family protein [Rhodococcus sp. PAE-6]QXU56418.1 acyl-CoA dehydrogenase family protein [Rhodococcus sp. LW-XY12]UQB75787.1 acyl-CoA dehydrogenase family protein [Rhodococcus ruber]UVT27680.1 acyl-CoA dehydrogenase family protein [Rhodococcus pyridinivorans]WML66451.1 acyl-CoA dehydrogenase family protein [Rhodococcus sp. AH-ZY2]
MSTVTVPSQPSGAEELDELRSVVRQVAQERYAPFVEQWDRDRETISTDERRYLAQLGWLGIALPEEYGGAGGSFTQALTVVEELAKVYPPAAFQVFEANVGPAQHLSRIGTKEQLQRFLPGIISGENTMAVGISEPDAGSAATDMVTRAEVQGDTVVVRGLKRWISNGGEADRYLVYARMGEAPGSRGIGAVIVESDRPGVSFGKRERLMGFRGIPSADVILDNVEVPIENLVVSPPDGFRTLFSNFSIERLGNTTMSLALGQAALDKSIAYVQERLQFGRPIVEFQSVQLTLADMALQVESARLLRDRAVAGLDAGRPSTLEVSLAKCAANEMAKRVTDMAMTLHGANGYSEEYGLERMHRDAHGWALAGGTPNMQRIRVVSELLGRGFDQRAGKHD